jgi:hypothetical protein
MRELGLSCKRGVVGGGYCVLRIAWCVKRGRIYSDLLGCAVGHEKLVALTTLDYA